MFERLKKLYDSGRLSASAINSALAKGWITAEQAAVIVEGSEVAKAEAEAPDDNQ